VHQVVLGAYSSDGGRTWSEAAVLQDFPRKSDFDPAFIADGRRTWFFFSAGRWNRYPFVRGEKDGFVGPESYQTYARWSDDSGRTWSEPTAIAARRGCRSNGIRLATGELLLPTYDFGDRTAGVLRSADSGKTWQVHGRLSTPAGADEPTIAELAGDRILMYLRTRDGFLWRSFSRDRGQTWSQPEQTPMVAAAASHNVFRLRDGRLVLTHDASPPPRRTPLTLRVSSDGETWGEPLVLAEVPVPGEGDDIWGRQVTYPSVAELTDAALLVVWAEIVLSDTAQYGDIRAARIEL
jgi:Neuraminidase (sialidase)